MSTLPSPGATKPPVDFDQEVRFAVVMYGGSSLAIYINGVAQELLRLVRATAPEFNGVSNGRHAHLADEELRGPEKVYRRLGRLLRRQGTPTAHGDETNGTQGPIRTRFVVDILTGTSAGGINAVYLAKALSNNQNIDKLKNLWVTEGDIGALINDEASYGDLDFKLGDDKGEPWSVLNSRRMHRALLEALRGMDADKTACKEGTSPLVDELDLYVTATDMFGRPIQMRLADDVVSERRHRNVFQFRYRSKRASEAPHSDFGPEYNPFLAFVARATSAHQAAFSPIRLKDLALITGKDSKTAAHEEYLTEHKKLRDFYRDYLLKRGISVNGPAAEADPEALIESLAKAFHGVWFVDGGTLDNKPFSFVSEELPLRHADTFVDRKLLYIEPSPEQPAVTKAPEDRPRIVANALAGLSSLPRYETIVEDLTRLLERNRLVERLDNIMRGLEKDLIYGMPPQPRRTRDELRAMIQDREKLLEWLRSKGTSWGSYQRLRVAEITDDLTLLVARAAGFSEESDEFLAIRYLVRHWRDSRYDPHMEDGKLAQLEFLIDFDLLWVMRRIRFVLKKLNQLACLSEKDEDAHRTAGVARGKNKSGVWPEENEVGEFRDAVQDLRDELNKAFIELRHDRRVLWARDAESPFREAIQALEVTSGDLLELLHEPTDQNRRDKAKALLLKPLQRAPGQIRSDAIQELTNQVKAKLEAAIKNANGICSKALRPPEGEELERLPRWKRFLRETLWYYYKNFEDFDQVSYPLLYSTGVGEEADVIDVFRVSPQDATALIDEREQFNEQGVKVKERMPKLAGTTLGNFGAFFERKFRINDIMWGRLDGAERIIAALLPSNPDLRRELTTEAHREIIKEEAKSRIDLARQQAKQVFGKLKEPEQRATSNASLLKQVEESLDLMAAKKDCEAQLVAIERGASALPGDSRWRVFLESFVTEFRPFVREFIVPWGQEKDPIEVFKNWFNVQYDEGRTFTQFATLNSAKRINEVLGDMALPYFAPKGVETWKGRMAMRIGRRVRLFTEAAIEPDGEARRKQRIRLVAAYVLSFLILAFVSLPATLLWWSATDGWSKLGFAIILLITILLALIPLFLTGGYNYVWVKLRRELAKRLHGARKTQTNP